MLLTAGIIPDTHRPYHDRKAYALMLKVFQAIGVNGICLLGDFLDFYNVSLHGPRSPAVLQLLKDEINDGLEALSELDRLFPNASKKYIEGNHEFRLERFLQDKAPELYGLVDVQTLLQLHNRPGWRWVKYGPNQATQIFGSKLWAKHVPSGNRAKAVASAAGCSIVYGHIHRIEQECVVSLDGTAHTAFSCGWLGDKRMDKIFGYVVGHHQWQLGFAIVRIDTETGFFYPQIVPILPNYSCVVDGVKYD